MSTVWWILKRRPAITEPQRQPDYFAIHHAGEISARWCLRRYAHPFVSRADAVLARHQFVCGIGASPGDWVYTISRMTCQIKRKAV